MSDYGVTVIPQKLKPAIERARRLPLSAIAHAASLVAVLAVVVVAARGQWFFYDEWDFLAERAEWALLAPHNGHLSLFPQLLTTLIKGVFGLSSYWPYLAFTILVHLVVVHMVWRLALRSGASPLFAVLTSTAFGVLAAGSENTLWAFQVGFITPLATGIGALLIVSRAELRRRDLVTIAVLLVVGAGFSGTALPMTAAVLVYLFVRHGLRSAILPTVVFTVVYGAWYLIFNREGGSTQGVRPGSLYDLVVRIPEYVSRAFIDSVGKMLPVADLSVVLLVALVIAGALDLRRRGRRSIPAAYFAAFAALVFAVLSAYARVGLGLESASAGRYVYVYAAMLAPGVALALTALGGRRTRIAPAVLAALMVVVILFNGASLVRQGRDQALLERNVERAISAAVAVDDGSEALAGRTPAAILAPTLTMIDIRSFVDRGQFTPVEFTAADALDVDINLRLGASMATAPDPDPDECLAATGGLVSVDPNADLIWAPISAHVRVTAREGDVASQFANVHLDQGWNRLNDIDLDDLRLTQAEAGGICVVPSD